MKAISRYGCATYLKPTSKYKKNIRLKQGRIRQKLKMCEHKFNSAQSTNLPSYQDRYRNVISDMRNGKPAGNMLIAETIANNIDLYLKHIWQKNPVYKKLQLALTLRGMKPEKHILYRKAQKILKENNLLFDKMQLADLDFKTLKSLSKGEFVTGNHVLMHGQAYYLNFALRRGFQVKDIEQILLNKGFEKIKPLKYSTVVFRKVQGNKQDESINFINRLINAKKGETFTDLGYSYATIYQNKTMSAGNNDKGSPIVIMQILVPPKSKVSRYGFEFLFPKDSRYEVIEEAQVIKPEEWKKFFNGKENYSKNCMKMTVTI